MSLFDSFGGIMKSVLSGDAASEGPSLITTALSQAGGLQGIVSELQQGGLGAHVQSWLGDGANLPISADEIRSALGDQRVQELAEHFGVPIDGALKLLSDHLPAAVDQASSDGAVQTPGS